MGTGLKSELTHGGLSSRAGRRRVDTHHQWLDPLVVAGPWVLGGWAAVRGARRLVRAVRS